MHDEFTANHVYKIRDMCLKYITEHEFYCLTDCNKITDVNTIPLVDDLQGWWSKLELFKISGPVLYLDLDVIIVNNIDDIINEIKNNFFVCLTHWNYFKNVTEKNKQLAYVEGINTSLMYWENDISFLYNEFKKITLAETKEYNNKKETNFLYNTFSKNWNIIRSDQDVVTFILKKTNKTNIITPFPRWDTDVVTFRRFFTRSKKPKHYSQRKIIVFHGSPRPWEQDIIPY